MYVHLKPQMAEQNPNGRPNQKTYAALVVPSLSFEGLKRII